MKIVAAMVCALALTGWAEDGDVAAWCGAALSGWKGTHDCADVRVEDGVLKGRITDRDSQITASVPVPFLQEGNQVVYVKARVAGGGLGQLFWVRDCDRGPVAARRTDFHFASDGTWRTYRIRPGWAGTNRITRLRLDFPPTAIGKTFELASVVVRAEGEMLSIDAKKKIGVSFSLQMPPGHHYCTLTWSGSSGRPGQFGFMPATDGRRHTYWFDLRKAVVKAYSPDRGRRNWVGRICRFDVEQVRQQRLLPVEGLTFCEKCPDTPADVTISSARAGEAIPRAGRECPLEVVLRNFGTRAAERVELAFDGLPAGVRLVDPAAAACASLPSSDGADSIGFDCLGPLVSECVLRPRFTDLGVGRHAVGVTLKVGGEVVQRVETVVDVQPSLALAKADYPPPPVKVDTAPYEIGAFLFPGWVNHKWHAIWSHAPWRKPVLGWYDETNPETIDWQIKHLAENGVSYVLVDWYWTREKLGTHHWMDAFAKARYRSCLKWSVMWANHNSAGSHYAKDQEAVTRYWIDNYFADPQYQRIDGMPVVTIWSPDNMEKDMAGNGGCKALLEISQRLAREAGYKGIYFIAVRRPDSTEPRYLKSLADKGFSRTCVYKYVGEIPGAPRADDWSRPYSFLADTSLAHWRELGKNGTVPFMPSLTTAWDDRPWRGEIGWEITGINARDLRRICADARRYSDESGERLLLMGPLDEWGEGSIGYPNAEHGFGMLEAVRDTFGKKPEAGWPVNFAPEDIGLACPQRP